MNNTPTIETERLVLRKFNTDDINAFYTIFSDKSVNKYLPWYPVTSLENAKRMMETKYLDVYKQEFGYQYAICLKEDNIPIGYIGISDNESYDLGYGLLKEYWHKGIVTEACNSLLQRLNDDNIPFITATHDVDNPRSGSVMKALGMKYQYSYVEQWMPKDIQVTFRLYLLNLDHNSERTFMKYWNKYENHFIEIT